MSAQSPELQWVALSDGIEMEIPETVKANTSGDVFVLADFYSSSLPDDSQKKHGLTTDYMFYNLDNGSSVVEATSTGAPDNISVNGNANLVLYKMGKDGRLIWKVNSNIGNYSSGTMAPTTDGGAIVALKMRHTARATYKSDVLLGLVDAAGKQTNVEWNAPDYETYGGVYQPVLVKIDGNGNVEWTKLITVGYKTETIDGSLKKFSDNFDFSDLLTDEEDNIYLTGNYRTSINFGRQANLSSPHNVAGWDGDTQKTRGDMFLVKLDKTGTAKWNVVTKGEVVCERPGALAFDGTDLYLVGYLKGNDDKSQAVTLGDYRLTPSGGDCLYYACISTEGTVKWARMIEATKNDEEARRIKPMCISVNKDKGSLLLGGSFLGNMVDGSNVILSNPNEATMGLRAFLLQCDISTGDIQQSYGRIVGGLTEIESAYRVDDKIYTVAYELYNAEYLFMFDATLDKTEEHKLVSCTQISVQGGVILDDLLICAARVRSDAFGKVTFPGTDLQLTTKENNWACVFTGHLLPDSEVAIEDTDVSDNDLKVYAAKGSLIIESEKDCRIDVFGFNGQLVKSFEVQAGRTVEPMSEGLYIVNRQKVIIY